MPRVTALSPVAPVDPPAAVVRAASLDLARLRTAAHDATALLRALANEDRLLILCQLTRGELSVGELEAQLDIRQPTLSQQLAVLRSEALVTTRRDGKRIYYAVTDGAVLAVLACLHDQFCPKS
ncbi:transcriptional regulator [Pandoraea anapnoica]|uniref:Transcriptional regulator n=1 Tax=Pandoraea anapnoica TaxID=2508301 RepID=A0A5E5AIT9_9BURK|nr:metalloregulator ArsR/SmtB family transcription factor [Pandoraea anapnoica]VVE72956.1 transcriptional regulator [Pandoraea anapnoica]